MIHKRVFPTIELFYWESQRKFYLNWCHVCQNVLSKINLRCFQHLQQTSESIWGSVWFGTFCLNQDPEWSCVPRMVKIQKYKGQDHNWRGCCKQPKYKEEGWCIRPKMGADPKMGAQHSLRCASQVTPSSNWSQIMTREIELTKTAESMGTLTYCRQLSLSEMSDWKPIVQDFFSSRGSERGYYCPIWTQIVTLSSQFLQTFRGNLEKTCQEMIGSHLSSESGWKTKQHRVEILHHLKS